MASTLKKGPLQVSIKETYTLNGREHAAQSTVIYNDIRETTSKIITCPAGAGTATAILDLVNDPMLELQDDVVKLFGLSKLVKRNKNKDIYFNLPKNKTKLMTVPYGEDPIYIVASFFQSDEGVETYKLLKKMLQ